MYVSQACNAAIHMRDAVCYPDCFVSSVKESYWAEVC